MFHQSLIESVGTEPIGDRSDDATSWDFDVVLVEGPENARVATWNVTTPLGDIIQTINGFAKSAADPILGKSKTPAEYTRSLARQLAQTANNQGFFETDAFLGIGGQVQIVVYYFEHYLEFTVELDGSISYFMEHGSTEIESREKLSIEEVLEIIRVFGKKIWTWSGSSAAGTTIPEWVDSKALPSRYHQLMMGSQ